jgi:hypothetical protein
MTQDSFLWTTGSAGDGSATFTRADWSAIAKIFAACLDDEGIAPNYLSQFAGSVPAANTFRNAAGAALVDGKPYYSDANVDTNIPSAVGGGNQRVDRVVLRADWTAQTVRVFRIAGTDAASPTPPAITQNSGTTYDIMLYQVRVNTSGTVTIELDERVFANLATATLKDGAVTAAKIADGAALAEILDDDGAGSLLDADKLDGVEGSGYALAAAGVTNGNAHDHVGGDGAAIPAGGLADGAVNTTAKLANDIVDDTKVGDRVPQFYRRQGGSASDWSSAGANNYTPSGGIRVQFGSVNAPASAWTSQGGYYTKQLAALTFPVAFSQPPIILLTAGREGIFASPLQSSLGSPTGFIPYLTAEYDPGAGIVLPVFWVAIGPE